MFITKEKFVIFQNNWFLFLSLLQYLIFFLLVSPPHYLSCLDIKNANEIELIINLINNNKNLDVLAIKYLCTTYNDRLRDVIDAIAINDAIQFLSFKCKYFCF